MLKQFKETVKENNLLSVQFHECLQFPDMFYFNDNFYTIIL